MKTILKNTLTVEQNAELSKHLNVDEFIEKMSLTELENDTDFEGFK